MDTETEDIRIALLEWQLLLFPRPLQMTSVKDTPVQWRARKNRLLLSASAAYLVAVNPTSNCTTCNEILNLRVKHCSDNVELNYKLLIIWNS